MCLWIILEAEFSLKLAFRLKLPDNREPGFFLQGQRTFLRLFPAGIGGRREGPI